MNAPYNNPEHANQQHTQQHGQHNQGQGTTSNPAVASTQTGMQSNEKHLTEQDVRRIVEEALREKGINQ